MKRTHASLGLAVLIFALPYRGTGQPDVPPGLIKMDQATITQVLDIYREYTTGVELVISSHVKARSARVTLRNEAPLKTSEVPRFFRASTA